VFLEELTKSNILIGSSGLNRDETLYFNWKENAKDSQCVIFVVGENTPLVNTVTEAINQQFQLYLETVVNQSPTPTFTAIQSWQTPFVNQVNLFFTGMTSEESSYNNNKSGHVAAKNSILRKMISNFQTMLTYLDKNEISVIPRGDVNGEGLDLLMIGESGEGTKNIFVMVLKDRKNCSAKEWRAKLNSLCGSRSLFKMLISYYSIIRKIQCKLHIILVGREHIASD
jgi:hypothetical protein